MYDETVHGEIDLGYCSKLQNKLIAGVKEVVLCSFEPSLVSDSFWLNQWATQVSEVFLVLVLESLERA